MKKSKWLSMLLIICMLLSLMPTAAFADDTGGQPPVVEQGSDGQGETKPDGETPAPPAETTTPEETTPPDAGEGENPSEKPDETNPPSTEGGGSTGGNKGPTPEQLTDGSATGKPSEEERPGEGETTKSTEQQKPTAGTAPAKLTVIASIADADSDKSFYNVIFAGGKNVTVEPAPAKTGETTTGLLVTISDETDAQTYTFDKNSSSYITNANDGLTIFAGFNGDTEKSTDPQADAATPVAASSTITIKEGAEVGAIFAGGYGNSTTGTVHINIEGGAKAGIVYGGGLTKNKDNKSMAQTDISSIHVAQGGYAGIIYAGGRAAVDVGITDVITFDATEHTATANNYVNESDVTIDGTVSIYMGGSYSYGGVGKVKCTLNGQLTGNYSAVCGTNGYRGPAEMTVNEGASITNALYCSMRGYVGDTTLINHGTIGRVSLNPDGKAVASYGNVYVTNKGTITKCNLDCTCTKEKITDCDINPYPQKIVVDGNVTVSTKKWEGENPSGNYTAQEDQTIVLLEGAKMATGDGEVAITNIATAQIGEEYYTLADAVDKVEAGGTIKLINDIELDETLNINCNKEFELDFNGHTIANTKATPTVSIQGDKTITIKDTTATEGPVVADDYTVQYSSGKITNGCSKGLAVEAANRGKVIVQSGTIESTTNVALAAYGATAFDSWNTAINSKAVVEGGYIIAQESAATVFGNGAQLEVNGGVIVSKDNAAVAGNGTCDKDEDSTKENKLNYGGTTITINGGTMIGHIESKDFIACGIYHPQSGTLTVNGGTIYADGGVGILMRNGALNVTDGTITGSGTASGKVGDSTVMDTCYGIAIDYQTGYNHNNTPTTTRAVSITGGKIGADSSVPAVYVRTADGNEVVDGFITGGYFTSDLPRKYIDPNKMVTVDSTMTDYPYTITENTLPENVETGAISGDPAVDIPPEATIPNDVKEAVKTAAESVSVESDVLKAAAEATIIKAVSSDPKIAEEAKTALKDIAAEGATITIVAKTYLNIKPQAYETDAATGAAKFFTLDIAPMYNLIATTANLDEKEEINTDGTTGKNAVVFKEALPLTVTTSTQLTVPLPKGFISDTTTSTIPPLYVRHDKDAKNVYYYVATIETIPTPIDASGGSADSNAPTHQATFTSSHGFSSFTLMTATPSVAVAFQMYNTNTPQNITYSLDNTGKITSSETGSSPQIEQALPSDTRDGYNFQGWSFFNGAVPVLSGPYKQMNSTLLSQLAALDGPITATPQFTSTGGGGEPEKPDVPGDETTITILFDKYTATDETLTFTKESIGQSFPTDKRSGYTFRGWTFSGIDGVYKSLEQALFDKLAEMTGTITATPSFRVIDDDTPSDGGAIDGPGGDTSDSSSSGGSSGGGTAAVSYTITASAGDGGVISPAGQVSAASGTDKTFTITANAGYILTDVLVDGQSVGAVRTYTFENITKAHTISALFAQTTGLPFSDVTTDDWFYPAVKSVYEQELMRGLSADVFGPNELTTRGMIVTILYRLEGEPQAEVQAAFDDVARSDWYAQAIDWAAAEGIVNGYSATSFGPNDPITREQLAAILRNYAAYKGQDVSATADLSGFTDQPSDWALASVQWAVAHNLLSGKGDGVLDAAGYATRAEAAAVLTRFLAL